MNTGELAHVIDTLIGLRGMVLSGRGFSMPSMVEGIDEAIAALKDGHTAESATHEILASMCQLLEELLAELKRGNSIERTGSVSSVAIEDYPTKDRPVRISTKHYAGSVLDVDEALERHGYAHRRAEELAMSGWQATVDMLQSPVNA